MKSEGLYNENLIKDLGIIEEDFTDRSLKARTFPTSGRDRTVENGTER